MSETKGGAAAMREALENCAKMGEQIDYQLGSSDETVYAFRYERCLGHNISECARAALSAPPRNCDVGSVEEQTQRLRKHCSKYKPSCKGCEYITDIQKENCWLKWAQMPYDEGEYSGSK